MSDPHPRYAGVLAATLLVTLVLAAANLVMGDLNQDEGWYLYEALRVAEGWLPYRDFAFTQGPMLPLVYAWMAPVIEAQGVAGGRLITVAFGLMTLALAGRAAARLGGASAGIIAAMLIGVNVYHGYFTTVVKTYALCGFFLMLAVYALARWSERRQWAWLLLAGAGLAAAAGTRLSSGILLPLIGCWLLFQPKRCGAFAWWWFGLGGGLTLVLIFGRFFWLAPEGLRFGLLEYHTLRESGDWLSSLILKGGFISRLVQAYFVAMSLLALLLAVKMWRPFKTTDTGYHQTLAFSVVRLLWLSVAAVTLVHLTAPFPYDDYQVPVFPVLAVALAVSWSHALRSWSGSGIRWTPGAPPADPVMTRWFLWCLLLVGTAASFSSPINMDWMISGRDRIWWNMKAKPSLLLLRDIGAEIRRDSRTDTLLTQDTYLAVEAGKKVPRGWEMGPFSYYPDMPDERAAALHLSNRASLLGDIASSTADFAAISGYGLAIASPHIMPLASDHQAELRAALDARYAHVRDVPAFGQANTVLSLYRLREPSEVAP